MTERLLFDVVLSGGAIVTLVALSLLWHGWRLYAFTEAKNQRDLTHALQRAARGKQV